MLGTYRIGSPDGAATWREISEGALAFALEGCKPSGQSLIGEHAHRIFLEPGLELGVDVWHVMFEVDHGGRAVVHFGGRHDVAIALSQHSFGGGVAVCQSEVDAPYAVGEGRDGASKVVEVFEVECFGAPSEEVDFVAGDAHSTGFCDGVGEVVLGCGVFGVQGVEVCR